MSSTSKSGTVIRDATPADAEVIAEFNTQIAWETEHQQLDPAVALRGAQEGLVRPDLCRYFVAEQEGRVVGQAMVTYEWSDWHAGLCWWIQSVFVRPECRGQGVFQSLYRHIVTLARADTSVRNLRLYVEKDNRRAMAAYEKLGMVPSGHVVYQIPPEEFKSHSC